MRVLLTGATGLVGSHIARLVSPVHDLLLDTYESPTGLRNRNLECWREPYELDSTYPEVDAIVHCGAVVDPRGTIGFQKVFDTNVRGTLNLAKWALDRQIFFIHISGAIVYKYPYAKKIHENSQLGVSGLGGLYGLSKLVAEQALMSIGDSGLKLCVLRPTSVYGYKSNGVDLVSRFIRTAMNRENIRVYPPLTDSFNLVHAHDLARAVLGALSESVVGTFNIGQTKLVQISELAEACHHAVGHGKPIVGEGRDEVNEAKSLYMVDISHAQKNLRWSPIVDISTGVSMVVNGTYIL